MPLWIDVLKALLTPVIALLGIWIAYAQWKLANAKFRNERFEKRMKIFDAVAGYMSNSLSRARTTNEAEIEYLNITSGARFQFDEATSKFCREVRLNVHKFEMLNETVRALEIGPELDKVKLERVSVRDWLSAELESLECRFSKHLDIEQKWR